MFWYIYSRKFTIGYIFMEHDILLNILMIFGIK